MSRITEVCQATWDEYRNTKDVVLRERIHAVLLSHDGRTRREIAEILFCEVSDFKPWLTIYKEEGLEGLRKSLTQAPTPSVSPSSSAPTPATPTPTPAPAPKVKKDLAPALVTSAPEKVDSQLQEDVQTMIRECLRFSPKIYGRRTNVWSTKALADVLAKNLGREVPRDQIRSFLQNAGVAKLETTQQFVKRTARLKAIDPATLPGIAGDATAQEAHAASPDAETSQETTAPAASEAPPEAAPALEQDAAQSPGEGDSSPETGGFADPWAAGASSDASQTTPETNPESSAVPVASAQEKQES